MKPNEELIKEIFALALEKKSLAERERYLAEACQGRLELRQQVESLLRAHEQAGEFLGKTMKLPASSFVVERAGTMIGRYKLLEQIGEGGFGTVWMAEQEEPVRRRVALKIIKPGMDTKLVLARFEAERQALALMDHPSIARVFDGGATDTGRPYFVMELVRGVRITDYCDANKLSTRQRLALFIQVCQAVQHAHQKGIIHRDLKPSNILVTEVDGAPVPKVIDFGVAKAMQGPLTERTLFTGLHQLIGTPAYMSPEQAGLGALDMDTRSDIYALGVLLYELLTGQTPLAREEFEKAGMDEIFRLIREQDPPKPSTRLSTLTREELSTIAALRQSEPVKLNRLLSGELDWIVMKALEKDRRRRYETAGTLAQDVRHHLNNEPVVAAPPSWSYLLRKTMRKHRRTVAVASALAFLLVAGTTVSLWQWARAVKAEEKEKAARQAAELSSAQEARQHKLAEENARKATESGQSAHRLLYAADMRLAQQAWEDGNLSRMDRLLQAHHPQPGEADPPGFEWFFLKNLGKGEQEQVLYSHTNVAIGTAISPDGKWLASRSQTEVQLWDLATRRQIAVLSFPKMDIDMPSLSQLAAFSPSFSYDSQFLAIGTAAGLQLFHIPSRQTRTLSTVPVGKAVFSPVTNQIAFNVTTNENVIRVWDYVANKEVSPPGIEGHGRLLGWSPDGTRLVTGRGMDILDCYDTATSTHRQTGSLNSWIFAAVDSPDGRLLAAADWQGNVHLLETIGFKEVGTLATGDIRVSALAFSPDGKLLATGSGNEAIQIWDVEGRRLVRQLRGHRGRVTGLAFTPDGRTLASTGLDGKVILWNPLGQTSETQIPNGLNFFGFNPPQFSPDGKYLGLVMDDGARFSLLNSDSLQEAASINTPDNEEIVSFSPDSKQLVILTNGPSPELLVSTVGASSNRATIHLDAAGHTLCSAQLSPDGTTVAVTDVSPTDYRKKNLFKAATGEPILSLEIYSSMPQQSCFLPDGRTFASSKGSEIQFWDLPSREKTRSLECNVPIWVFSVSPDGKTLAAALYDNSILVWDLKSGAKVGTLSGNQASVQALAFSPDGRTLASGGEDRTLRLWNLATQRELASFTQQKGIYWLAFSPDNQLLVSGGIGSYQVWRAPRGGAAVAPGAPQMSFADLPANSIWRVPDVY